ncbi:MAG: hypothetical protein QOI11_128 [Candidatus Eremiobacteraeota bacterium]|jgi:hypothetical protein|nr:hypothetical protein [Candidatus Eremiobacteraeota bacterium]
MFPALGSLLAKSVAPAVAEQLARHGLQALQVRLRRDPSLAPATSAEIVAAVNHYNATPERTWTRERLFEFVAFFVSADPSGAIGWIETPGRIADYVLRGARPGEDPAADRTATAAALVAEMEAVRELMVRYLELLTAESIRPSESSPGGAESTTEGAPVQATAMNPVPSNEPEPPEPVADPDHARLNDLLARVTTPAGAALAQARERARRANENARRASAARRARALVAQSLKLLHAGGVGLAQAEAYLLRKGYPAEVVRAVVAGRIRTG